MKQLLLIVVLSALMAPVCNPDMSKEGNGNSSTGSSQHSNRVPIDGGIALLAVGGIMLGLYKLRSRKMMVEEQTKTME
jgi:hypothetical protein